MMIIPANTADVMEQHEKIWEFNKKQQQQKLWVKNKHFVMTIGIL